MDFNFCDKKFNIWYAKDPLNCKKSKEDLERAEKLHKKIKDLWQSYIDKIDFVSIFKEYVKENDLYGGAFLSEKWTGSITKVADVALSISPFKQDKPYNISILKNRDDSNHPTNKLWENFTTNYFMKSFTIKDTDTVQSATNEITLSPQQSGPAYCIKCNYKNDYLDHDPNYVCYKCKHF